MRGPALVTIASLLLVVFTGCAGGQGNSGDGEVSEEALQEAPPETTRSDRGGDLTSDDPVKQAADEEEPTGMGGREAAPEQESSGDVGKVSKASKASEASKAGSAGNADKALVVVDREHGLAADYVPDDLVSLKDLGIRTLRGERLRLRDEAAEAASRMISAAEADGIRLVVNSAYRSHEEQLFSYERLKSIYGEQAEGFSAHPGHSEHQLGTVIDVSTASTDYRLTQSFGETEASRWLVRNAADYGFVLSYPEEAEETTGYLWEPWHYRYIGPENAHRYYEGDYESPRRFFLEEGVIPGA